MISTNPILNNKLPRTKYWWLKFHSLSLQEQVVRTLAPCEIGYDYTLIATVQSYRKGIKLSFISPGNTD